MRLTRKELAAAIRASRRYPKGFGFRWGCKGVWYDLDGEKPLPSQNAEWG